MSGSGDPVSVAFRPVSDDEVEGVVSLWRVCGATRPWNDPHRDIALARSARDAEVLIHAKGAALLSAEPRIVMSRKLGGEPG